MFTALKWETQTPFTLALVQMEQHCVSLVGVSRGVTAQTDRDRACFLPESEAQLRRRSPINSTLREIYNP